MRIASPRSERDGAAPALVALALAPWKGLSRPRLEGSGSPLTLFLGNLTHRVQHIHIGKEGPLRFARVEWVRAQDMASEYKHASANHCCTVERPRLWECAGDAGLQPPLTLHLHDDEQLSCDGRAHAMHACKLCMQATCRTWTSLRAACSSPAGSETATPPKTIKSSVSQICENTATAVWPKRQAEGGDSADTQRMSEKCG